MPKTEDKAKFNFESMASSVDSCSQSSVQPMVNDLLLKLIEQMKQSDSKISALIESQQRINDEIKQSESKLSAFIECQLKTNDEINGKLDQLNRLSETVASNTQRISFLESDNVALRNELQSIKSAQLTRQTTDANELIVSGLPDTPFVTPIEVARNLLAALGASDFSPHILNVRAVHRPLLESACDRPRAVATRNSYIITVTSGAVRDSIISKKRAKGVLRQGEICDNDSKSIVYVNELLSKDCYELLQQTKRVAKERSYKYVWVKDGRICVRHSDGVPVVYIGSSADLAKLN